MAVLENAVENVTMLTDGGLAEFAEKSTLPTNKSGSKASIRRQMIDKVPDIIDLVPGSDADVAFFEATRAFLKTEEGQRVYGEFFKTSQNVPMAQRVHNMRLYVGKRETSLLEKIARMFVTIYSKISSTVISGWTTAGRKVPAPILKALDLGLYLGLGNLGLLLMIAGLGFDNIFSSGFRKLLKGALNFGGAIDEAYNAFQFSYITQFLIITILVSAKWYSIELLITIVVCALIICMLSANARVVLGLGNDGISMFFEVVKKICGAPVRFGSYLWSLIW